MPEIKLDSMASEPVLEVNGHKEEQEAEEATKDDDESSGEMDVDEDSRDVDVDDKQPSENKSHRTVIKVSGEFLRNIYNIYNFKSQLTWKHEDFDLLMTS